MRENNAECYHLPAGGRAHVLHGAAQHAGPVQSRDGAAYVLAFATAGGSHRLQYPKPAKAKAFATGSTVTLYYDPEDPEKMYVEGDHSVLGAEVLYAVVGAALLVLTVGIAR